MLIIKNSNFISNLQIQIFNLTVVLLFCFIQISLNFLSIFSISQPYLILIFLYFLIIYAKNPPSNLILIFLGVVYDLITGINIGIHSIFFFSFNFFLNYYREKLSISKKFGEWILFSTTYFSSLVITKLFFVVLVLKVPDLHTISFNLGSTLLIFIVIKTIIDIPRFLFSILYK